MRAVVTRDYGSAPALVEVETPTAGPGEIRVKVRASSLNGFDTALVRGFFQGIFEHSFPVVLGRDFAGTVDQVGPDAAAFAVGDNVFGVVLTQPLGAGGFGEYLVLPADHNVARMPDGLDFATAGALGLAGAAALTAIEQVAAGAGHTVLVAGATGGVGAVALQTLAAQGCVVIATAGSATETEHVRKLGAHHSVDHTGDVPAQVRAIAPDGVDIVLHLAGDPMMLADLLVSGGQFATLLGIPAEAFAGRGFTAHSVVALPTPARLSGLAGEVAAGRVTIPIQRTYSLDEVPAAFDDFAAGTLGKLSISLD